MGETGKGEICQRIRQLVDYGLQKKLLQQEDKRYTFNRLLELFGLDGPEEGEEGWEAGNPKADFGENGEGLEAILADMLDYAAKKGLLPENSLTYRDLFDARVMGVLLPRPSEVIEQFRKRYREESPRAATDYYYRFSQDSDYIRRYRMAKDQRWVTPTEYGALDITINLAKPEKDPRAIAAARSAGQGGYPKCLLCAENEGYAGRPNHPARQNHRIIPVTIHGGAWGFQYSPYVYYNEHCIIFNREHTPMRIDRDAFCGLFDFVRQFPHYIVGSNADLPIVGGSILSHEHFQGGNYEFPMARAGAEQEFTVKGFDGVKVGILKWPMSVLRLSALDDEGIIALADKILMAWREYTDEKAFIYAYTNGEPHNTITPIARKRGENYELDLVLRNNITTKERPLGVYHPHPRLHHIKKENIGLIEVMGVAILPARLKTEMELLAEVLLSGEAIRRHEELVKHADWVEGFLPRVGPLNRDNVMGILQGEIGKAFAQVLEDAGVYKRTKEGQAAFLRFVRSIGGRLLEETG